jgi:hypothetical protein
MPNLLLVAATITSNEASAIFFKRQGSQPFSYLVI